MRTLYIYISKIIKNNLQNITIRTKLLPYRKITKKKKDKKYSTYKNRPINLMGRKFSIGMRQTSR